MAFLTEVKRQYFGPHQQNDYAAQDLDCQMNLGDAVLRTNGGCDRLQQHLNLLAKVRLGPEAGPRRSCQLILQHMFIQRKKLYFDHGNHPDVSPMLSDAIIKISAFIL